MLKDEAPPLEEMRLLKQKLRDVSDNMVWKLAHPIYNTWRRHIIGQGPWVGFLSSKISGVTSLFFGDKGSSSKEIEANIKRQVAYLEKQKFITGCEKMYT